VSTQQQLVEQHQWYGGKTLDVKCRHNDVKIGPMLVVRTAVAITAQNLHHINARLT
jgi:hypothetical protein